MWHQTLSSTDTQQISNDDLYWSLCVVLCIGQVWAVFNTVFSFFLCDHRIARCEGESVCLMCVLTSDGVINCDYVSASSAVCLVCHEES